MHYTTGAVILRSREFGEADRLLTLYTLAEGKVTAKVRGARRPSTRLGGSTLALSHVEVMLWRGRSSIETLTQAVPCDAWQPIRDDLHRLAYASFAVEMIDLMCEEREPDPETYLMLLQTMNLIAYGERPDVAAYSLALRLLRSAGLLAPIDRCVSCGGAGAGGVGQSPLLSWSTARAGLLCSACEPVVTGGAAAEPRRLLRPDSLAVLGKLVEGSPRMLAALRPAAVVGEQLRGVVWDCLRVNMERTPKSLSLLDSLPTGGGFG